MIVENEPGNCSALEPCCQNILGSNYLLFLASVKIMRLAWCTSQPCLTTNEQGQLWLMPGKEHGVSVMSLGCCSFCWTGGMEPLGEAGLIAGMGTLLGGAAPEMAKRSVRGKSVKGARASLQPGETNSGVMDTWTLHPWDTDKTVIVFLHWVFVSLWMKKY